MAKVDYATLKKGGFMRQKQKNNFSLRLACVGGALTAENLKKIAEVAEKYGDDRRTSIGFDEFDITIVDTLRIGKYKSILDWFKGYDDYTKEESHQRSCHRSSQKSQEIDGKRN